MPDVLTAVGAALGRRRAARRWRRFESGSAVLILMYHRVADLSADPNGLAVHPERFAGHLELLRRNYRPLSLRTLTRELAENRLPGRAVVVTFDDGYDDNLTQARPLLARFDVPATVFVVSGQVGADREFWWDELEQIVLGARALPRELAIDLNGDPFHFGLAGDACWTEAERERHRGWSVRSPHDPTARHRLFRLLGDRIRGLDPEAIRRAVGELARWAGRAPDRRASHAVLDTDGVRALAEGGLVEIGAHTVSHTSLPVLERGARRREIESCRSALEAWSGEEVTSFAYPFGRASGSVPLVRQAGYEAACSTRPGLVGRRTDPHRLPRLHVGDWETGELEARLRGSL